MTRLKISVAVLAIMILLFMGGSGWYQYFSLQREINQVQEAQLSSVVSNANAMKWVLKALIEDNELSMDNRLTLAMVISEFSTIDRPIASTIPLGKNHHQGRFHQLRESFGKAWTVLSKQPLEAEVEDVRSMVQALEAFQHEVENLHF